MSFVKESRTFEGVSIASLIIGAATFSHVLFGAADPFLVALSALMLSVPLVISIGSRIRCRRGIAAEVLCAVASAAAAAYGEILFAASVLLVTVSCRAMSDYAVSRTYAGIRDAVDGTNFRVKAVRDGEWTSVRTDEVVSGDVVRIRSGEYIPFDGTILDGSANVDTSLVCGQDRTEFRKTGDTVNGGTRNVFGFFEMEVGCSALDGTLGDLMRLCNSMEAGHTEVAKTSDRVVDTVFMASFAVMAAVFIISGPAAAVTALAALAVTSTAVYLTMLMASGKVSGKDVFSRYGCPRCMGIPCETTSE